MAALQLQALLYWMMRETAGNCNGKWLSWGALGLWVLEGGHLM
jgi:hypothetical protein